MEQLVVGKQGGQIGRIFAYSAIVHYGQCFENYRRRGTCFRGTRGVLILTKKSLGDSLGDFFQKLIRSRY
jgi:hypothetical protein